MILLKVSNYHLLLSRGYAKKAGKGVAAITKSKEIEVETDPEKLAKSVCINYKIGEQPIPIKSNSEYPSWLFELSIARRRPLASEIIKRNPNIIHEFSPEANHFWWQVRKYNHKLNNRIAKLDGWHRSEVLVNFDHIERFYGDWFYILRGHCQNIDVSSNKTLSHSSLNKLLLNDSYVSKSKQ